MQYDIQSFKVHGQLIKTQISRYLLCFVLKREIIEAGRP